MMDLSLIVEYPQRNTVISGVFLTYLQTTTRGYEWRGWVDRSKAADVGFICGGGGLFYGIAWRGYNTLLSSMIAWEMGKLCVKFIWP
jgi:hypothetical protein